MTARQRFRIGRPEEGWLTVALVFGLMLIVAWALDAPAWVNGKGDLTNSLELFAILGVVMGLAGPKLGWGRWTTHLVGALFAGLLIPTVAGMAMLPGASPSAAFMLTASGSINAYLDIAWRGLPFTEQEVHYIVVLGAIVWATGQFAAYAVFGHRRPLNAVVVMGLVLLVNMALTELDQLNSIVAFTAGSLFLLIEMHAFDERATWIRRRIGDPSTISSLYLRGGAVFIAIALVGSMLLTTRAASKPLQGAWDGVDDQLISFGQSISRLFPVGGALRPIGGVQFGQLARIGDQWTTDAGIAFTATVPASEDALKWRAATYDAFRLNGWEQTDRTSFRVDAGQPLLATTPEAPAEDTTRPITVTVRPTDYQQGLLLVPGAPLTTDQAADVLTTGDAGWFAGVDLTQPRDPYTVQARVLDLGDDQQLITGNRLEAAGQVYPKEIVDLYTQVPPGAIGPDARALLDRMIQEAGTTNPYRLAVFMQNYLQTSPDFTYSTDIRPWPCDAGAVECFARFKHGYCLHYASTMAIFLRAATKTPIPTRLVQGFLPGTRTGGIETVENRNAHAWVEVYFPGYGWIPFDPTGGVGQPTEIDDGPPVPTAKPSPSGSTARDVPDPTRRRDGTLPGTTATTSGGGIGGRTLFILLTVLLAIAVAGIALAAWVRGPRGEVTPDTAWRSMSSAASRLGFGPRPTQTVYEYAASLGDLVPVARADLEIVADAKVETAYAGAKVGGARLDAVRAASRRLRVSLLRLVLRRPRKRRLR